MGRQQFDEVQGQAVVVEGLADRVQGGLADLGFRFVDGQADQASDDQAGGVRVERGAAQGVPEDCSGNVPTVRTAVGERVKRREHVLHAATSDRSTRMPFSKRAPARTRGTMWAPVIARHRAWADSTSLNTIASAAAGLLAPRVTLGAELDRGEGRLYGVGDPQVDPVLDREVVERKQSVPVLGDLRDGLGELGAVGLRERLDRLLGVSAGLGVVDLLHCLRRAGLRGLGQAVGDIAEFVNSAPLRPRGREHLERPPKAHGTVPNDQLGVAHAASAAVAQQVGPRLGRLPQTLGQGDQFLGAVQPDAEQDQDAGVGLAESDLGVHAVGPDVDEVAIRQVPALEGGVILAPLPGQPGDGSRGQAGGGGPEPQ